MILVALIALLVLAALQQEARVYFLGGSAAAPPAAVAPPAATRDGTTTTTTACGCPAVKKGFEKVLRTPSDINEHVQYLRELAGTVSHVTELGVRFVGGSSWAFAMAGVDRQCKGLPYKHIGGDITRQAQVAPYEEKLKACGLDYTFREGDDLVMEFEPTELLFIDTWHVYRHLIKELHRLETYASKYIVLHDTTSFGTVDEDVNGHGGKPEFKEQYEGLAPKVGLWTAVKEFLEVNPNWKLKHRFTHNNGVTVLERVSRDVPNKELVPACGCPGVQSNYELVLKTPSDINEHVAYLRELAGQVTHVTELGVRFVGGSSWAFAMAGVDRKCKGLPFKHIGGDITRQAQVTPYENKLRTCGLDYTFREGDDLVLEYEPTELLFIDTWHVYRHLIKELHKLEGYASKYIVLHDTSSFGAVDEDVNGHGGKPEFKEQYEGLAPKVGLWTAVEEFLAANPNWKLKRRFTHNNGLTVLERVSRDAPVALPELKQAECGCSGIQQNYERVLKTPSDINEHVAYLRELAGQVTHVTELGVRFVGGSSWAFAMAGVDRKCKGLPFKHIGGDITRQAQVAPYENKLHACGLDYTFREGDDLVLEYEPTELLFIDTWHVYRHLIKELHKLEGYATKYIVLHDTTSFGTVDEDVNGHGGKPEFKEQYEGLAPKVGLWTAVEEFLAANPNWKLKHRFTHNNGVTVLERVSTGKPLSLVPASGAPSEATCAKCPALKQRFNEVLRTPSDINEHLQYLRERAGTVSHVTELGVRFVGGSSWAFAMAGLDRRCKGLPYTHVGGDITRQAQVAPYEALLRSCDLDYTFREGDDLVMDFDHTELLFIDTWHVYRHLIKELVRLEKYASKYIVLHDTSSFGSVDEDVNGHGGKPEFKEQYEGLAPKVGLWTAVEEFLEGNKHWRLKRRFTHNNGVTVLERVSASALPSSSAEDKAQACSCTAVSSEYARVKSIPSDINEHMEYLRKLAGKVSHVTELGVRFVGGSSWAFAMAGVDRKCEGLPFKHIGGDITRQAQVTPYENTLHACGLDYTFREGDDLVMEFEPTELLFIDTWHVYRHLIKELHRLEKYASKYIVLHDTTSFGTVDEDVNGHGGKPEFKEQYEGVAPKAGLWTAVEDFLAANKYWRLKQRFEHNNGVTVLERVAQR